MITYKMHLIRTGRTFPGDGKRYVGQSDPPLCAKGLDELEALRREFTYPRVEAVFTSPLRRCVQTADMLYPDILTESVDGLMDMNLGSFEGKTFEQLRGDEAFRDWLGDSAEYPPPGGEQLDAFTERVIIAVNGIFNRMMTGRMTSVAVVTHGGVIMTLLAGIGLPKQQLQQWATANGTGYTLLFTPQMWMRDGCAEVYSLVPGPPEDDFYSYDIPFSD